MPAERFFDSGGIKLHYLDWDGAGRPLVLLAGLGNTAQIYRGLAPGLATRFRVAALTRRGHGRSDRPDGGYDLETLVEDIRMFLDTLGIERAILAGHSFAGLEMPRFAVRYPRRVEAIIYLDALFPALDREPDFSDDPVWSLPPVEPQAKDLASLEAYLAFMKRARPDWARIWCQAIEADLLDKVKIHDDGTIEDLHDDELMNCIAASVWPGRDPEYDRVRAPMLAIVPGGNFHHGLPLDATDELRQAADRYWVATYVPWLRQRTKVFRQAAPTARVVELDAPHHLIFIAKEDETVEAINGFLANEEAEVIG